MNKHICSIAYLAILIIVCSCSERIDIHEGIVETVPNKQHITNKLDSNNILFFKGSKILGSKSQEKEYSEEQAKEILNNLKITIAPDTVKISDYCTFKIHKDPYNVNATKYDTYFLIMNECDVSKSDALCISNFNGTNEGCGTPYSELIQSQNEIIYFDNGWFFYFKKDANQAINNYKINNISGIVGDTRQEWKINYTFSGNIEKTYEDFIDRFPFGGKYMKGNLILKDQFDTINDIKYIYKSNSVLEFNKNISVGTIHIKFKSISSNITEVEYYLSFPFENTDYDG